MSDTPIASREWVKTVIGKVRTTTTDDEMSRNLRIVAIDYGRIAHSHKLLEEKCAMLARKVAEKDERIRKLILDGVDDEQRKRFVEAERRRNEPIEYTEDWRQRRRGGYGD